MEGVKRIAKGRYLLLLLAGAICSFLMVSRSHAHALRRMLKIGMILTMILILRTHLRGWVSYSYIDMHQSSIEHALTVPHFQHQTCRSQTRPDFASVLVACAFRCPNPDTLDRDVTVLTSYIYYSDTRDTSCCPQASARCSQE